MSSSKKILIVDDERILRLLVRTTLESDDYQIVEADSGDKALQQVDTTRFDLVLLDWMMPGLSGIEVARQLRNDPDTRDIPIIMLTAKGQQSDRQEGAEVGVYAYLVKPFSPLELIEKVEQALNVRDET